MLSVESVIIGVIIGIIWYYNRKQKKLLKKNAAFGRYPSCDQLNNALRFLNEGKYDAAKTAIVFAIDNAGGYFHEDLKNNVEHIRHTWHEGKF